MTIDSILPDSHLHIEIINESEYSSIPFQKVEAEAIAHLIEDQQQVTFSLVEIVFVSVKRIVEINQEYLERDYITDIISFSYHNSTDEPLEGTLFICANRIFEQAEEFADNNKQEFLRIVTHGMLHLTGLDDQSDDEKKTMTSIENSILEQLDHAE